MWVLIPYIAAHSGEKLQTGSSEFASGRDSMLIDLSSWYKGALAPKIEVIQDAIEKRRKPQRFPLV